MKKQTEYTGVTSIESLRHELKNRDVHSALLVRDKNAYFQCGASKAVEYATEGLNIHITEFYDFEKNPKIEDVKKGLSFLDECNPDLIIGIGGGSALDMAKLMRFFHSFEGDIAGGQYVNTKSVIPLIAIPTTAGTGSESTHFAVVYRDSVKYSVAHDEMLPDAAIVYPPFTYSASPYLAACTGFDALSQAIEAWWNVNANPESDEYARKAIRLLWENLPPAVNLQPTEAKNKVAEGAHWAGKAINITKTTAPHAMSYAFTTLYGIPHGHAVALTFPFWAEINCRCSEKLLSEKLTPDRYKSKIDELLKMLNFTGNESVSDLFIRYITNLHLSFNLPEDIDKEAVLKKINLERLQNNPCKIDDSMARRVFDKLLSLQY
ncbi:MAG: phosphonoacetaldehyde reductase [Dysgonamonadaceae bacterium]|jgi:alcohol dehydrogenase class IV|nr:phosphonoacetaldehyde reductase [Dysgonamonadaceae bacterium]